MKKIRIATLVFFLFICLIIVGADTGNMPHWLSQVYHFPNGDKVGHFVLYGIMAFLMNLSFPKWNFQAGTITLPGGSLLFSVFSILEEISQSFFASRNSSLLDVTCSLLGILAFSFLSNWFINRHGKSDTGNN
jgi:VanZ family protein